MPYFNYNCEHCGLTIENHMVKKWDDIVLCTICHEVMKKQPSGFNFTIDPAVPRGM